MQIWNGYSSHQPVLGENPNLSNIMQDTLPALEGTTRSEVFSPHINALHATRNEVNDIKWCPGKIHLADCMTKLGTTG